MEIKITTQQTLKVLYVVSWIIFLGLCVEAGGIVFNSFFTLAINPDNAKNFWEGASMSSLYAYDSGRFLVIVIYMSIVSVLKALMFYQIVMMMYKDKIDMAQPFNMDLKQFISNLSYFSFGIGLFSKFGEEYCNWLVKQGVKMPDVQSLHFAGADVWLFMGIILVVIAQIFKKGIEIQAEHELTV